MPPLRILISRPDRLGDVVLSTPLPREIKRKYPDSYIVLLLREYTKNIYINNPYVDDILIMDEEKGISGEINLIRKIKEYNFTYGFMLLPSKKVNRLMFLAGIKKRIGVGHKLFQFISNTKGVYRNKYIPLRHESDYCLDFVRKLDIQTEDTSSDIYLSDQEKDQVKQIHFALSEGKFLVGINTTSGNSAPNWSLSDYSKLIKMLSGVPEIKTIITDYDPPVELSDPVLPTPNKGKQLRLSILNFAAIDVLVSSSTGPMHICAGLQVPTISLFCPMTACSPELWGPAGNKSIVLLADEDYCSNKCPGDPKICTFSGKGGISPERVYGDILKLFGLYA